MLGLHWIGSGSVSYRVHRLHGAWGRWVTADADAAPDGGTGLWHEGGVRDAGVGGTSITSQGRCSTGTNREARRFAGAGLVGASMVGK